MMAMERERRRARTDSMSETISAYLDSRLREIRTVAPCVVLEYDSATRRAVAQPAIRMLLTDGSEIERAPLVDVPVAFPAGGGVELVFDLQPGDTGLLLACERDIGAFKKALAMSSPGSGDILEARHSVMLPTAFGSPSPPAGSYNLSSGIAGGLLATLTIAANPTTANTDNGRISGWTIESGLPGTGSIRVARSSGFPGGFSRVHVENYTPSPRCFAYLFIAKVGGVEKARAVMPLGPTGLEDVADEPSENFNEQYGVLIFGNSNPTSGYDGQIVLPRYRAHRGGTARILVLPSPDGWDSDGNITSYTTLPANSTIELREAVI